MAERILLPPEHTRIPKENPLIFLAGPVQGSVD